MVDIFGALKRSLVGRRSSPAPVPASLAFPAAVVPSRPPRRAHLRHHHQGEHYSHEPDTGDADAGVFFRYRRSVPAGPHSLRHAVQFAEGSGKPVTLSITCADMAAPGQVLGGLTLEVDVLRTGQDVIDFSFDMPQAGILEVSGRVNAGLPATHLRYFAIHAEHPGEDAPADFDFEGPYDLWPIDRLRNVIIGTTGVCNASCPHCPTNKLMLEHLRREPMKMELFTRLIDGLAETGLGIEGVVAFGLHGDALMDPLVVERARYVKQVLPKSVLLINTNAGPFNERRHAELVDLADIFSIHTEALSEDLFARLMAPLRASVVQPKIERLIELAPHKAQITVPLSQVNLGEFRALRDHWLSKGATSVVPLAFGNRTTDALDFYSYALAPVSGCCRQEVAFELVVDWDGVVMACCQDFSRTNQIGDLTQETVRELLLNEARKQTFDVLKAGRWSDFSSCRTCKFDSSVHVADLAEGKAMNLELVIV
jgi:radical SAM protein with 4Fe4S-binding SPASM domain